MPLHCFKAYDIRGKVPDELDTSLVKKIAIAYSMRFSPKTIVLGHDIRLTGPAFCQALTEAFCQCGVDVYQLGLVGTEEIYHAVGAHQFDGGIMVTASHNPKDYNGLKLVTDNAKPISRDSGLLDIEQLIQSHFLIEQEKKNPTQGQVMQLDCRQQYIKHLLSFIDPSVLKPFKIIVNSGNGSAPPIIDALEAKLPFELIKLNHICDGNFPNGVPNPLLVEKRQETRDAVLAHHADFAIAFDGDFDRCFFFDEKGRFIEGYYIVGLLSKALLSKHPGQTIVHDPRLIWNTLAIAKQCQGRAVQSQSGHSFMKECLRKENAIYGGEMSAHHYFRDFFYCDSGMIPWLMVAELMSRSQLKLSQLVDQAIQDYPVSGEINRSVQNPQACIDNVQSHYKTSASNTDHSDGFSAEFNTWRFNIRSSNTEPLIRINIETRNNPVLLQQKTDELMAFIDNHSSQA